jgi:two-component system, cell cycle response regulator
VSSLLPFDVQTSAPPWLIWSWAIASLLLASALGFAAGAKYANRSADRGFHKALRAISSLYTLALESLDKAQHLSSLLENYPGAALTADQVDRLDSKRGSLMETVSRMVSKQREGMAKQLEAKLKPKPLPIPLEWERKSVDPTTGFPDRSMFDTNLHAMLKAGSQTDLASGLLLVKIDRRNGLKSRFGIRGAEEFDKGVACVISKALREQDLACRLSEDTFGILFPSVDGETGHKLAQAVRNAVRFHTFRSNGIGPEVLVTASFGYTTCGPADHPESALSRAGEAMARSAQRGRNQLHLAEGASVVHCAVASS